MTYLCTSVEYIDRPRRSHLSHYKARYQFPLLEQRPVLGTTYLQDISRCTHPPLSYVEDERSRCLAGIGIEGAHLEFRPHYSSLSLRPAGSAAYCMVPKFLPSGGGILPCRPKPLVSSQTKPVQRTVDTTGYPRWSGPNCLLPFVASWRHTIGPSSLMRALNVYCLPSSVIIPCLPARSPAMLFYHGHGAGPRLVSDGRTRRQRYGQIRTRRSRGAALQQVVHTCAPSLRSCGRHAGAGRRTDRHRTLCTWAKYVLPVACCLLPGADCPRIHMHKHTRIHTAGPYQPASPSTRRALPRT